MGMGYGANFAETIEEDSIAKLCPKKYEAYSDTLEDSDIQTNLNEFAMEAGQGGDLSEFDKQLVKAYEQLCNAFHKKTGLYLNINYHSSKDDGDRYDEVDEFFWEVSGMYTLTKAGKKMKKYVERKFFVTFG